jgi:hypothetical protein
MNKLIFAGAAALALAVPSAAQETMAVDASGDVYVLTAPQQSAYDAWPAERQTAYTAWPNDYKVYYWTLTEPQQTGWWALTDAQRTQLYAMTPEARTAAWASIASQMASMPSDNASTTAQAATSATATQAVAGEPRFVSGEVLQTTAAGTRASGEYPICSASVTDSCINPREAGKNYGNRPLNYWPGKPASQIPGQKPQR